MRCADATRLFGPFLSSSSRCGEAVRGGARIGAVRCGTVRMSCWAAEGRTSRASLMRARRTPTATATGHRCHLLMCKKAQPQPGPMRPGQSLRLPPAVCRISGREREILDVPRSRFMPSGTGSSESRSRQLRIQPDSQRPPILTTARQPSQQTSALRQIRVGNVRSGIDWGGSGYYGQGRTARDLPSW